MVCICKKSMATLYSALPQIGITAQASMSLSVVDDLLALSQLLSTMGLPAPPWTPDPAWLELQLPQVALSASAMATISAFAQLRADMLAQLGVDLLAPGQASALTRLAVTMQARLAAMLAVNERLGLSATAQAWMQLSASLSASVQVQAALALGLLPAPPPPPPLAPWQTFLAMLRALLPIIAVSSQLNLNMTENISAQLAAQLRVMLAIRMPAIPPASLQLMASITGALTAMAQIQAALGVSDVLALGLPRVQVMVTERVNATVQAVQSATGMSLPSLLSLLNLLPRQPLSPATTATQAVVAAAMRINASALAAVNWQVPAVSALPVLSVGLPVVAFAAQLNAALGLTVSASPCGGTCDAAALMQAFA